MEASKIIVFDMDGVLVDPTGSYRQAVVETVAFFGGATTFAEIEDYKNQGGWNNDWALTERILADQGIAVSYARIQREFKQLFEGPRGLVMNEQWLVADGLLERLGSRHRLGIFTGRLEADAMHTLQRFAPRIDFNPRICIEHVAEGKPAPDGLLKIQREHPGAELVFLGDTIDDARSARLAGVPFYGVAKRDHLRRAELLRLFAEERAAGVIENVNEIEAFV
jgi:HAD superfamily hydrolase (TIGR01548 family)